MSRVYDSILQGLNEAVAYTTGSEKKARVHTLCVEPIPSFGAEDVKAVRGALGMTQVVFASVMGVSKKNC